MTRRERHLWAAAMIFGLNAILAAYIVWGAPRCLCALGAHYGAAALDPADCQIHGRTEP